MTLTRKKNKNNKKRKTRKQRGGSGSPYTDFLNLLDRGYTPRSIIPIDKDIVDFFNTKMSWQINETSTFYDIYNITPDASNGKIKQAFTKLALKLHSDKTTDYDLNTWTSVEHIYKILLDNDKRIIYNELLNPPRTKAEREKRDTEREERKRLKETQEEAERQRLAQEEVERKERQGKEDAEREKQIERETLEQERLEQELTNKILKNIKEINNANNNIKEFKKRFIEDKSKKKLPEEKLRPEDKTRLNNKIKSETDKIKKLRDENKILSRNISPDKLLSEQLYVDEQQNIQQERWI